MAGKGGSKKIVMIAVPVVLIGAVLGLGVAGIINIPGLSPKKKPALGLYTEGAKNYAEDKKDTVAEVKPPVKTEKPPAASSAAAAEVDEAAGAKKLAQYWNGVPTDKLVELSKSFREAELAEVLVQMDPEKVAEFLGVLDSKRSARLCKELQRVASILPKKSA